MTLSSVVLPPGHPAYPERLSALGWRRTLHVRGALPGSGAAVAIVGARAASQRSMDRAHALGRHLAGRGVAVISGGALGIDGAAHRGALAGRGATTVVLGSGIDVAYPARHARLFDQIVARGGALVSQLPPGTQPRRGTFLQRNPLIAALADVVVVVEAEVASGSLTTARAARKLGRIVCAWPGSRGCDRLLASGAAVVEGAEDVDAALGGAPRLPEQTAADPVTRMIVEALAGGARDIDEICDATGLPVRVVLRALPELSAGMRKL